MRSNPTVHALRVFGGAIGMALFMAGLFVSVGEVGYAMQGCTRCLARLMAGVVALLLGGWLVRGAWREMRVPDDRGGGA